MRHGNRLNRLGRPADQRKALLRALVTELLRHGQIRTTKVCVISFHLYQGQLEWETAIIALPVVPHNNCSSRSRRLDSANASLLPQTLLLLRYMVYCQSILSLESVQRCC